MHMKKLLVLVAAMVLLTIPALSQAPRGGRGGAGGGRQGAAIDLTGYWVSVLSEDWEFRMVTPDKGVFDTLPLSNEGRRVANTWDPAKDEAAGEQCRAYGAGNIMRMPTRLHITWENDTTLRIDTDAGTQTRMLRFGAAPATPGEPTWQGYSSASWEAAPGGARGGARGAGGAAASAVPGSGGNLKVVTTNLNGGYLLSSRDTYSDNAVLTENFTRHSDFGLEYFTVTAVIEDGGNPRVTSSTFKKEPNGSKFAPTGCEIVK